MVSDEGEYVGGGKAYAFRAPPDRVSFQGYPDYASFRMGGFTLEFAAPPRKRLRRQLYVGARRYLGTPNDPFRRGRPGLSIRGRARGCNEVTGRFRVLRYRKDRRGIARSAKIRFEHHCEGDRPAIRGTLTYVDW